MKRTVHSNSHIKCAAIALMLLLSSAFAGAVQAQSSSTESLPISSNDEAQWQRLTFDEEEISVLTPVSPAVIVYTGDRLFFQGSDEKILEERKYSGYSNGFIYAIDSYKVKNPQRLLKDMVDKLASHLRFEKDLMRDGFKGKQYRMKNPYYSQVYFFAAARHVYIITLAVSDEANTSPAKFLSSLRLGDSKDVTETNARPMKTLDGGMLSSAGASDIQAPNRGEIFRPSAVTRKKPAGIKSAAQ